MGAELKMQPALFHLAVEKDVVYTPPDLALDMVKFFSPSGVCLDPCAGNDVFFNLLPDGSDWCEISRGRDFYAWTKKADWIISNPPYSHLLAWIRYSFTIANDIVYLIPTHRLFASTSFLDDLMDWGGIVHIRRYGTGAEWGFPFGHDLSAVYYRKEYQGGNSWSRYRG